MKTATAKLNHLRMAPRKTRLIANMIKGLSANEAEAQLLLNPRKASEPILKLLRSAIANGKQKNIQLENLFVKEIRVDQGPMLKRFMPRAQGRATPIQKKTSHITLILAESEKIKKPRFKIVKPERIKKSVAEKIKKEKLDLKEESMKEAKPVEKSGFGRKMFRRKSI
ncbi:MAG: 50S ribosomal protein L22 [Patescibacteria group bacterium]|nr:50S ribosomal protein L22 [Patescibacteria group bacterium]